MFKVRVLATEKEIALITQAARKQGLSAPQFVTRVVRRFASGLNVRKITPRRTASPGQTKSLRKRPKS